MHCLALLLALLAAAGPVTALRCYACEDCDETVRQPELEVCSAPSIAGGSPIPGTSPSPGIAPSSPAEPAAPASPAVSPASPPAPAAPADSDYDEDYESDESATVGIMPGNAVKPAPAAAAAPAPAPAPAAIEDEDEEEEEDYDERRKRMARQQPMDMPTALCYVVRLELNGTVITNRGCTVAMSSNRTATCESLFNPWKRLGCQLCDENNCNGPIDITTGQMSSVSPSSRSALGYWSLLALTLMAIPLFSFSA